MPNHINLLLINVSILITLNLTTNLEMALQLKMQKTVVVNGFCIHNFSLSKLFNPK